MEEKTCPFSLTPVRSAVLNCALPGAVCNSRAFAHLLPLPILIPLPLLLVIARWTPQSEELNEVVELRFCQRFCKDVCYIVVCWDVFNLNFPVLNRFANKMIVDVDVFGPRMEFIVL